MTHIICCRSEEIS